MLAKVRAIVLTTLVTPDLLPSFKGGAGTKARRIFVDLLDLSEEITNILQYEQNLIPKSLVLNNQQ